MKSKQKIRKAASFNIAQAFAVVSFVAFSSSVYADVDREFIAPHEYSLPSGAKPMSVFVQYAEIQNTDEKWNSSGSKLSTAQRTQTTVGLTKFVRMWNDENDPNVGYGWEFVGIELGSFTSKSGANAASSSSGFIDPILGPFIWYHPAPNWTLGMDFLPQIPVGTASGQSYNFVTSIFWDGQFDKFNYTGNIETKLNGSTPNGVARAANYWNFNNRFGYRMTPLMEPYIGIDYQNTDAIGSTSSSNETVASLGVMFHMYDKSSLAVHFAKGVSGENQSVANTINLRWVYVF